VTATALPPPTPPHPLRLAVDLPSTSRNRLTVGLRFLWIVPIAIVLSAVSGGGSWSWSRPGGSTIVVVIAAGGFLFWAPLLLVLFRQKYPRWWFDWNLELLRFQNRVGAYLALLNDQYPSTDEHQSVRLELPYPDAKEDLNRWLPLVKWLLAIPHYIVLAFLWLAALFVIVFAWFAILFTGRYPRGLFEFVVGVGRWTNRVTAYAFVLVTDQYPPFSLSP